MTTTVYMVSPFGSFGSGGGGGPAPVDFQAMFLAVYMDIRDDTIMYMTPAGIYINASS